MKLKTITCAGLMCFGLLISVVAHAATSVLGDFFTLEYDASQIDALDLFGDPKVGGNAVKFQPTGFLSSVLGLGPIAIR